MENKIRYWREYHGLSQRRLAELVGVSSSEMSYIESGKRSPDVYIALDIAAALDKSVEELFERRNQSERKKTASAYPREQG